jgi:hypothetical protein
MVDHASDSREQREAEVFLIDGLSRELGMPLVSARIPLEGGTHVVVDGFNPEPRVVCEAYAHIGSVKGAQLHKIARDILKLFAVEQFLGGEWRKILCFADDAAANGR